MIEELYHRTPDATIIEKDPRRLRCLFSNWTAPLLAEYLAQQTGIRLDESRIRHLRRKVTHNTFFQTIDRLLDAVTGLLRDMVACPQTV